MAEIIGQLVNKSAELQRAVSATGPEFAAAERSLSESMEGFRNSLSQIAAEIAEFNQSTRATLNDAGSLAEMLARHRESLCSSADELSREQSELDQRLAMRRDAIESLLNDTKMRRDDLEQLVHSFAERIEEEFQKSEARAREIGAALAQTSDASGDAIEGQFADIRASIGEERERMAAELRAASEQAKAELETYFGQTAERFQTAAAELRDMSREIQRELAETRESLRRGAAELPGETAQQAASMRRVVADQIKALEELSEIVTRSGRAYDISQPASAGIERYAAAGPASQRRMEAGRQAAEPLRSLAQASRAPARPEGAKSSERGGGWISDLLARVDSGDPRESEAPPAKSAQPPHRLESIAPQDVARMIDHAAAADAWERYRRGEADAFSRRQIYVGRGPQVFDDIDSRPLRAGIRAAIGGAWPGRGE
jgi:hypothetical protein